jgi:hypothetical protein
MREPASPSHIVVASIPIALGLLLTFCAADLSAYALSAHPDTARSELVVAAVPFILGASALVAVGGAALRRTSLAAWLTKRRGTAWIVAADSLALGLAMVWVGSNEWSDLGVGGALAILVAATCALGTFLIIVGTRYILLPVAATLVLCGALAAVASSLPD